MKAVVAAFNQDYALWMELFEALVIRQLDMSHYNCVGHYSKSVNLCLVAVVVVVPTILASTCTLYSEQYRVLLSPTAVWYGTK